MNLLLWVLQGGLAAFFLVPAVTKVFTSKAGLVQKKMIMESDSVIPARIIGSLEILGIVGIILPWLLQVYPKLTPVSAIGFAVIMVGAFAVHFSRKDYKVLPMLVGVCLIAVFVAWFRF